jgi:hypothetical protein
MMHHSPSTEEPGALITLPELLEDPKYRDFFRSVPKTVQLPGKMPWRLIVQREPDGAWARKDYEKYADAFRRMATELKGGRVYDGTIQSRGIAFGPPQRIVRVTKNGRPVYHKGKNGAIVLDAEGKRIQRTAIVIWKPKLEATDEPHTWCTYCRRPTVFRWFNRHHSLRRSALDGLVNPADRRCTICGAREEFIRTTVGTARPPKYDPLAIAGGRRRARR